MRPVWVRDASLRVLNQGISCCLDPRPYRPIALSFSGVVNLFRDFLSRFRPNSLVAQCSRIARKSIPRINDLLALTYTGRVVFRLAERSATFPAAATGNVVMVNPTWFAEHPSDDGAIVHELVHVVMHVPRMDQSNGWMIEGLADYVRDKLGYTTPWSAPTRGNPKAGYQQTAHFLLFVEERFGSDYIKNVARVLSASGDLPPDIDAKIALYVNG